MEDSEIIGLFERRDESAVAELKEKYGGMMERLAQRICPSKEDAEEAVSDAVLGLWNAIPPSKPDNLRAYVCRAARNSAAKKLERNLAAKRSVNAEVPLEELETVLEDVPAAQNIDGMEFRILIEDFLDGMSREQRVMFVKRYFFYDSVPEIAADMSLTEGKVKTALFRMRKKFREYLERSGKNG